MSVSLEHEFPGAFKRYSQRSSVAVGALPLIHPDRSALIDLKIRAEISELARAAQEGSDTMILEGGRPRLKALRDKYVPVSLQKKNKYQLGFYALRGQLRRMLNPFNDFDRINPMD